MLKELKLFIRNEFTVVHSSRLFISLRYGLVSAHTDCLIELLKSSAAAYCGAGAYVMRFRYEVKSLLIAFVESFSFPPQPRVAVAVSVVAHYRDFSPPDKR
ncbi:hypothetical protein QM999_17825 [Pectobacterium cacticida]|uniref:hypothetical protein n=2 Tax=Pectobacterium cacticida TaxID=69221 RepID=UPI002FEF17FF